MKQLHITVKDKVAEYTNRDGVIVCGNSDYQVVFAFDSSWDGLDKTARFVWGGKFYDVPIGADNTCIAPVLYGTTECSVGVYSPEKQTTTSARIPCQKSILCETDVPAPEYEEPWAVEAQKSAEAAAESASSAAESASSAAESERAAAASATEAKEAIGSIATLANIAQTLGDSETEVMSQKAVTDALDDSKELLHDLVTKGEHILNMEWENGSISTSNGAEANAATSQRTVGYFPKPSVGTFGLRTNGKITAYLLEYDADKNFLKSKSVLNSIPIYPTHESCAYIRVRAYSGSLEQSTLHEHVDCFIVSDANAKVTPYAFDHIVFKSINHRGYNRVAPENTLPAYRLSAKNGFPFVECDIGLTADKVPVLLHDDTINRTARNADGTELSEDVNLSSVNYADLASYDFGIWKSSVYAGTKIPTFEEFIILCRDLGLYPYMEMKSTGGYTQSDIDNIVATVKKYGMERSVSYISFDWNILAKVANADRYARLGLVCSTGGEKNIPAFKTLDTGTNSLFVDGSEGFYSTEGNVELCINENLPLEIYSLNTEEGILALHPYISGCTSDTLVAAEVIKNGNLGDENGIL